METETNAVEEIQWAAEKILATHQKLPSLANLSPEQKAERPRVPIRAKARASFEKAVSGAKQNRKLIPESFDLSRLEADAARIHALTELSVVLARFSDHVDDTLWVLSKSALPSGATANAYLKVASAAPRIRRRSRSSSVPAPVVVTAVAVDPAKQAA